MGSVFYTAAKAAFAIPRFAAIRERVFGMEHVPARGPFILAVSHLSHLEPFFVGALVRPHVRWMSRIEFYRPRVAAAFLNAMDAFPVDRFGNASPAVRTAVRILERGGAVGMFPEGGVAVGRESVLRGGAVKQGVCTIAIQAQTAVVPVVVLGTDALLAVRPWLPIKSGRVDVSFGPSIQPPRRDGRSRRALRAEMAGTLTAAFVDLYRDLLRRTGRRDEDVP
ncbi:MAG TPA: lysophospholipid acyltransferase family protein [Phycisphaerales bacterium]|nr:lysophospholipid acyltransferase family protein [Phycisphaerales bacterium]